MSLRYTFCVFLSKLAAALLAISISLEFMKFMMGHGRVFGLTQLFNVNAEVNIPTFFSVTILLISAALLHLITYRKQYDNSTFIYHWKILTLGFYLMAAEEMLSFHETLTPLFHHLLPHKSYGLFFFSWVIPGIVLVLVIGICYIKFLIGLPAAIRIYFIRAAIIYCSGIIGMEMMDGWYAENFGENFFYNVLTTIEEGLEMFGIIYFIDALLAYLTLEYDGMQVELRQVKLESSGKLPYNPQTG